jgi:hypothetical protein
MLPIDDLLQNGLFHVFTGFAQYLPGILAMSQDPLPVVSNVLSAKPVTFLRIPGHKGCLLHVRNLSVLYSLIACPLTFRLCLPYALELYPICGDTSRPVGTERRNQGKDGEYYEGESAIKQFAETPAWGGNPMRPSAVSSTALTKRLVGGKEQKDVYQQEQKDQETTLLISCSLYRGRSRTSSLWIVRENEAAHQNRVLRPVDLR